MGKQKNSPRKKVAIEALNAWIKSLEQAVADKEQQKTECFKGIDTSSNTTIGKANRELLKKQIEIAGKEDGITKRYERGE